MKSREDFILDPRERKKPLFDERPDESANGSRSFVDDADRSSKKILQR
jgi:hypothetical protein